MDLLLVAPATDNTIGKFAQGLADDFLSALHLATRAPVLMAPAMNTRMWEHPAVQTNVATLRARGVRFVEPGDGYLACGWVGKGRLAEPEAVVAAADAILRPAGALAGVRVLVTAGPTIEDIDIVRFLGNRSSGRMGFAIAGEARRRGADVTLVAGPATVAPPPDVDVVSVRSAADMHAAVMARAERADVVIMAAAVADYTPAAGPIDGKIEKGGALTLTLERTRDILADLGARRAGGERPLLVGFAAQAGDPVDAARRKLAAKQVDLIVANDVSAPDAGFDVPTNRVTFVSATETTALPLLPKGDVAAALLDRVEQRLASPHAAPAAR
jgi:phosphopantothenoylcysteine decarboxylase/phosphopantothenate--cysteine ligase